MTSGARGTFVSLEGIDGSGKSTQAQVLAERLRKAGREVVSIREPGGTAIGERIRSILLDPQSEGMADECELLLYEASRAQLVRQVIEPALARGAVVVCDRFYDSTYAYQAGGRGLDGGLVARCNRLGSCGVAPDVTLVFDLDVDEAFRRATKDGADRLEAEGQSLQRRVREAYLGLARREPERVRLVDATGSEGQVASRVARELAPLLPELAGEGPHA